MAFADVDPRLWQFIEEGHVSTGNSSTSCCSAALIHGNRFSAVHFGPKAESLMLSIDVRFVPDRGRRRT